MVINIAGLIEKTYWLSDDTKLERYSPIEYDNTRTIRKLSTAFKHIRYCVEQGTTDRCSKYRSMLLKEDQDLTIALQDTGSKYLINDNDDQTAEWLSSSSSNKRLRRAALSRRPSWCPPRFICHGRTNITRNMNKNLGSVSPKQTQTNSPAHYNVNLQVKSTAPIINKPSQPPTQQQQQQDALKKKKLVIVFHETKQLVMKRKRRDAKPGATTNQQQIQKNLGKVLDNIDRCLSAMKFMRRMQ